MLKDVFRDTIFDDDHVDMSSVNDDASKNFMITWKVLIKKCTRVVCFCELGVVIRLFHLKCLNKVTNKAFDMLLDLLPELVPNREGKK